MHKPQVKEYDLVDAVSQWEWDEIERTGAAKEPDNWYEKFMRLVFSEPRAIYRSVRFPIVPMHVKPNLRGGLIYMSEAVFNNQLWNEQYYRYIEDKWGIFWVARTVASAQNTALVDLMKEYGRTEGDIVRDQKQSAIHHKYAPRAKSSTRRGGYMVQLLPGFLEMHKESLENGTFQGIKDGPDLYCIGFKAGEAPWVFESDEKALETLGVNLDGSNIAHVGFDYLDGDIRPHWTDGCMTLDGSFTREELLALIHFHPKERDNGLQRTEEQHKP